MANGRLNLTRDQLASFLPDHQAVKQFEKLFEIVNAVSANSADEVGIAAENAGSRAQQALDALQRLANALELLALSPSSSLSIVEDAISISSVVTMQADDLTPPVITPPLDLAYGELYATNATQVVVVAAANTAYEVTGGMTAGLANRVNNGGAHYLEIVEAGVYQVIWSMSIDTAAAADEIEGGVMLNGGAQNNATSHTTVSAASGASSIAASGFFRVSQGDQVSLFVRNHTAARNITVEHIALTIWRIGR